MFSGLIIPCDAIDRLSSGKYALFGTYSQLSVNGRKMVKDLHFYVRITTEFEGKFDGKFRFYDRGEDGNLHPILEVAFSSSFTRLEKTKAPAVYEIAYTIPKAEFYLQDDMDLLQPVELVYDVVLSSNEIELARTTLSVIFRPAPAGVKP